MGSVIDIVQPSLPARLAHARNLPAQSEIAQAKSAHVKTAIEGAGASTKGAAIVLPHLKLRRPLRLDAHAGFCHVLLPKRETACRAP